MVWNSLGLEHVAASQIAVNGFELCQLVKRSSKTINIYLRNIADTIVNKISNGGLKTNSVDLDDDEDGGTDSAQDLEGSADQPLDF